MTEAPNTNISPFIDRKTLQTKTHMPQASLPISTGKHIAETSPPVITPVTVARNAPVARYARDARDARNAPVAPVARIAPGAIHAPVVRDATYPKRFEDKYDTSPEYVRNVEGDFVPNGAVVSVANLPNTEDIQLSNLLIDKIILLEQLIKLK